MTDAADQSLKNLDVVEAILAKNDAYAAGGPDCELECWQLVATKGLPEGFTTDWLKETIAASKVARKAYDKAEAEKLAEQLKKAEVFISAANTQSEQKPEPSKALVVQQVWEPKLVAEYNGKHCIISDYGGHCMVMEIVPGTDELAFQSFKSFKERYQNDYHEVGPKQSVQATAVWLAHPLRRQYERLDLVAPFCGGDGWKNAQLELPICVGGKYTGKKNFNLWRGFGVTPKEGSWELLNQHLWEVISNCNEEFYLYLLNWIAWVLQNPGKRPEVVLALTGGKGTGKGVLGQTLVRIFGQHGIQVTSTELLCGTFNGHLQDKLFLYLDEAVWAGDMKAERTLKGLVTEPWMMVHPKFVNAYKWPNRLAFLMTGNDKWIVPASEDERRYAVNQVSEKYKQQKAYFDPLWKEIENGGAAAMLYEMLGWDIGDWHPREGIPQTKSLMEQKLASLDGKASWYQNLLSTGVLPGETNPNNPRRVNSEDLMADCKAYSPLKNKYLNSTELGLFLKEQGCVRKSNGKKFGWVFPPLAEARKRWVEKAGEWEWEAPDLEDWAQTEPAENPSLFCYKHNKPRKLCGC